MTAGNTLAEQKRRLRAAARHSRRKAAAHHGAQAGWRLAGHGIACAGIEPPAWVSAFLPIGDEIDVLPLLARLARDGYKLCLPVIEGKGVPLIFRAWHPEDPLREVQWGIKEPLADAATVEPDVVLGPLLAFDDRGHRLGYGGGYYDRSLKRLRAMKPVVAIGVAFDEQRVDAVPHAAYDERLDWVLTPSGPTRLSGR